MSQESVKNPPLPKPEIARIEQRTLFVSLTAVLVLAVGSILYGLIIESDVVILNGVLSLISLVGSSLNLWGAKLVTSKEDNRFQFGYWHIEPLIHCSNALMLLLICIYGALSGIEQLRGGGNPSDPAQIILFSVVSGAICGAVWIYEVVNARRTQSQFIRNDSNEWLLDFCLSIGTMLGFIPLFFLSDPLRHF
ncbi:MAG: cation transporter [Synergistaceae bacterium]|nr:cation transporter [Synergistaceae bacterium]MBP9626121.1 cation transporter [Synergistaceae bacterium]MBP9958596.1 cation transporter [Synergistaceae bacterium]